MKLKDELTMDLMRSLFLLFVCTYDGASLY